LSHTLGKLAVLRPRPPVIVVDNASTDATASVARAAAELAEPGALTARHRLPASVESQIRTLEGTRVPGLMP
jgi:hypothetical protein